MVSRKQSARKRQVAEFQEGLGSLDDLFAKAERERDERREEAHRARGCERKNRYATRSDAEEAIASCAEHGRRGLHCYKCEFCGGWHLTSRQG